jgi:hypothetical protein
VTAAKMYTAFAALVVLATVRVPLLPGWQVPLGALVLMLVLGVALVFGTVLLIRVRAEGHTPRHARPSRLTVRASAGGAS